MNNFVPEKKALALKRSGAVTPAVLQKIPKSTIKNVDQAAG